MDNHSHGQQTSHENLSYARIESSRVKGKVNLQV